MSTRLSSTSYLVLGLVARLGSCAPYDLKQAVRQTINNFWSFPHSQLYAEPQRLKAAGYLKERREKGGRQRRLFSITEKGLQALQSWLQEPSSEPVEIRDVGLLKLFFGEFSGTANIALLAQQQQQLHRKRLAQYEELCASRDGVNANLAYPLATLEMSLLFEQAAVAFWSAIAEQGVTMQKRLQPQWEEQGIARRDQAPENLADVGTQKELDSEESSYRRRVRSTDLPDHLL